MTATFVDISLSAPDRDVRIKTIDAIALSIPRQTGNFIALQQDPEKTFNR